MVPVSGNFHRKVFRRLALAECRVVFRKNFRAHKFEQRKTGENRDEDGEQFPFHGLLPDRTSSVYLGLLWDGK
jgi:hypothetical protein